MPSAAPRRQETRDENRTSPADPALLNAPAPDEPWARVWPGERILEGDIFYDVTAGEESQWRLCPDEWAAQPVPSAGYAIARLSPPDGYRGLEGSDVLRSRDLAWSGEKWVLIRDTMLSDFIDRPFSYVVERWEAEHNTRPMVCTRKNPAANQVIEIPTHHRKLWASEAIRRGDKYVVGASDMDDWADVPVSMHGLIVEDPEESNDFVRYCRPVSPNAQIWYVDPLAEEGGVGGRQDPFKSLDQAKHTISVAAEAAGTPAFGIILSVSGKPLLVYDLPEPEAEEPPAPELPVEEIPDREESTAEAIMEDPEALPQPVGDPDREKSDEIEGGLYDMLREDSNKDTPTTEDTSLMKESAQLIQSDLESEPELEQLFQDARQHEDQKVEEMLTGTCEQMAAHLEVGMKVVMDQSERVRPPQYTRTNVSDVIEKGDLWFGPIDGDFEVLMWQPVPATMIGQKAGDLLEYLLARKRTTKARLPAEIRQQVVLRLEEIHTAMDQLKDLLNLE